MAACPACSAGVPAGARFCPRCGAAVGAGCAACGEPLEPAAAFCPSCGTPRPGASAPVEERKLVTVLFADVTGSTALGDQLDAERLQRILREYFAAMEETVRAWGGTVEKFIGDAVMAAFGVPSVREDDAERALNAGLEMLARLGRLNPTFRDRHGIELAIRIGVNTGEVIAPAGPVAAQIIVAGDAVNVAARLQAAAEPGTILAGERTYLAARNAFVFEEPAALELKGKREPVTARRVVGPRAEPVRGVPGLSTRLVGRDRQVTMLEGLLDEAIDRAEPRLALVYGPAGIGKTRLTTELVQRATAWPVPPQVLRGRSLAAGHGITYWALGEILRAACGIRLDDPAATALDRVQAAAAHALQPLHLPADQVETTIAALAATAGIPVPGSPLDGLEPSAVAEALGRAWPRFVTALAAERPLIIVLEDLHWAGVAMVEMVQRLLDRSSGPILFVATARPEFAEQQGGFAAGRDDTTTISLRPLTHAESGELVDHLLDVDDLPATLREHVLERADGNPFFLEEIVRRLIDEGAIAFDGARWRATAAATTVTLPDTIHALLAARIDTLPPAEKQILQAASVVGRIFWPGAVGVVVGDVDAAALGRLEQRGLIAARPVSTIAGQAEYAFRHALIRDVAYGSLPRARRATAHAAVGRWSEGLAGDRQPEFAEVVAFHLRQAVAGEDADLAWLSEPDRREKLRRKAFRALLDAGRFARHRSALARAAELDEQALALAADDAERAEAQEALGDDHSAAFHGELATAAYEEALRLTPPTQAPTRVRLAVGFARITVGRAGAHRVPPPSDRIEEVIDEGLALATDDVVRSRLLGHKAQMGAYREVHDHHDTVSRADRMGIAEDALALAESSGDRESVDHASGVLSELAELYGSYERSLQLARESVGRLDGTEPRGARMATLVTGGAAEIDLGGDLVRAVELLREAREIARPLSSHEQMHCTGNLARTLYLSARWDELEPVLEDHLALYPEEAGVTCGAVRSGPFAAQLVAAWRGDRSRVEAMAAETPFVPGAPGWAEGVAAQAAVALRDLERAVEIARPAAEVKEPWRSIDARAATLDALALLERWDPLRELIEDTRSLLPGHPVLSPSVHRAEGRLLAMTGDPRGGVALLEHALSTWRQLGHELEAAVTEEWLGELADEPAVRRGYLERALLTYESVAARPAADRVRDRLRDVTGVV